MASSRSDIDTFERASQELSDARGDRIRDHIAHWRLLVRIGTAGPQVSWFPELCDSAESSGEVAALADAYNSLGLADAAATLLESQMPVFNYSRKIWQRLANLLQKQRWGDLRALAFQVRASDHPREPDRTDLVLGGTGGIEPRSARFRGGTEARGGIPSEDSLTAFRIATGLQQNGFPECYTTALTRLEEGGS